MKTYSNPRMLAVKENWPYGQLRTTATFTIEQSNTRGERAVRSLVDPKTGRLCAPKKLTYATQMRIVDGDDGRTYIAYWHAESGLICIMQSNMQFQEEVIPQRDERFVMASALFVSQDEAQ